MSLDVAGIMDPIVSHALAAGLFERVNTVEPKNAPGNGLTVAIWVQDIGPVQSSGLQSTSGRLVFMIRIYQGMVSEPQDAIDPNLLSAASVLLAAYTNDFTLGGTVRTVDLLGQTGTPLSAQAGYITVSGTMYRCMDITLPVIINDIWDQNP